MCFYALLMFDVFMSLVCPMALACGASENSEEHTLGNVGHVPCVFLHCVLIFDLFIKLLLVLQSPSRLCVAAACGASETRENTRLWIC
jgi:hypothetical protein